MRVQLIEWSRYIKYPSDLYTDGCKGVEGATKPHPNELLHAAISIPPNQSTESA